MKNLLLGLTLFCSVTAQAKDFIDLKPLMYSKNADGVNGVVSSRQFQNLVQSTPDGIYLVSWMDPNLWQCESSLTQINSVGDIRNEIPEFIGSRNGAYVFYLGEKSEFDPNNANILQFVSECLSQVYQQGSSRYSDMADGTDMKLVDAKGIIDARGFYVKKLQMGKSMVSYGVVLSNRK